MAHMTDIVDAGGLGLLSVTASTAIDRLPHGERDDVRKQIEPAGIEPLQGTTESFVRQIRAESDQWGKLIRELKPQPLD